MHMYFLFLCFQISYTTHICLWQSFSTEYNSECCGTIIDNRSYAPVYGLEGKYRKNKYAMKNMLRRFFDGICIVEFAFKFTAHDYPKHKMGFNLLLYCNLSQQFGRLKIEKN